MWEKPWETGVVLVLVVEGGGMVDEGIMVVRSFEGRRKGGEELLGASIVAAIISISCTGVMELITGLIY